MKPSELDALKGSVPHYSGDDDLQGDYITAFAQPLADQECLKCGNHATFTWGLAHGEGHCVKCGWPARLYHFIKSDTGNERRIVRLLQYHPDQVTLKKRRAS